MQVSLMKEPNAQQPEEDEEKVEVEEYKLWPANKSDCSWQEPQQPCHMSFIHLRQTRCQWTSRQAGGVIP